MAGLAFEVVCQVQPTILNENGSAIPPRLAKAEETKEFLQHINHELIQEKFYTCEALTETGPLVESKGFEDFDE